MGHWKDHKYATRSYSNGFHEEKYSRKNSYSVESSIDEELLMIATARYDSIGKPVEQYLQDILDVLQVRGRLDKPVGAPEFPRMPGHLWDANGHQIDSGNSIKAKTIFFDGTDEHFKRTTQPILKLLSQMGLDPAALMYDQTMRETMADYAKLVNDKDSYSKRHMKAATKIASAEEFEQGFNFIGYSGGVARIKGMTNSWPKVLLQGKKKESEEAIALIKKQRILSVGIPPRYSEGLKQVGDKQLKDYLVSPEIALFNTGDMFPYSCKTTRAICAAMEESRGDWDQRFIVFHDPKNKNKVTIFMNRRIMVNAVNIEDPKTKQSKYSVNIGGHRLQNYFATLGFIEDHAAAVTERGKEARNIIEDFFSRKLDLSQTTLADEFKRKGFLVLPFDEKQLALPKMSEAKIEELIKKGYRKQIQSELVGENEHMLLGNKAKVKQKS